MASLKEVKSRILSVNSTQQITKAMKMVAAAKLRRAQDRVIQLRPYSDKLQTILNNLSSSSGSNSKLLEERKINKVLLIVVGSDRGLCGSFNSSVIKYTNQLIESDYKKHYENKRLTILPIGKKMFDHYKKRNFLILDKFWSILKKSSYDDVAGISNFLMNEFILENYDKIDIIFNEFKNVAVQNTMTSTFLPVNEENDDEDKNDTNYIFEPNQKDILNKLIPKALTANLFKTILESNASEQGARMTAMSQATDNATELLKELKLSYNRSRQAAITKEILEIVGGAEALNAN
jgi:F-type H+-transporting ATPase subunit gamma